MNRVAGVLGGMGPAATVDFFARVVALASGGREQDQPRLIIDNNPGVPDRNDAGAGQGPSPGDALAAMARGLERAGAEFLVMPCNAAHAYEAEIRAATSLPFVSMVAATAEAAAALKPGGRAGVLAADGCLQAGLYQDALRVRGLEPVEPAEEDQTRFMTLLYSIKRGDVGPAMRAAMRGLAQALVARGAELIVAGCTEVPLVLAQAELAKLLLNSTDVLAERTLAHARGAPFEPAAPS